MNNPATSQSNNASKYFESIAKIADVTLKKDMQILKDEAYLKYKGEETEKLEVATRNYIEKREMLETQNKELLAQEAILCNTIDMSRNSLELKSEMAMEKTTQLERLETEIKELEDQCKAVNKEYLDKYKQTRKTYEVYHPLYKQLNELQVQVLKKEIEYGILYDKIIEEKQQKQLCEEIHKKIFYAAHIKLAQTILGYRKSDKLHNEIQGVEKEEEELVSKMKQLELLAVVKEKEYNDKRTAQHYMTESTLQFKMPVNELTSSILPVTTTGYVTPISSSSSEMRLQEIRAKSKQKQQQWAKQNPIQIKSVLSNPTRINNGHLHIATSKFTPAVVQKRSSSRSNFLDQTASLFMAPKARQDYFVCDENIKDNPRLIIQEQTIQDNVSAQLQSQPVECGLPQLSLQPRSNCFTKSYQPKQAPIKFQSGIAQNLNPLTEDASSAKIPNINISQTNIQDQPPLHKSSKVLILQDCIINKGKEVETTITALNQEQKTTKHTTLQPPNILSRNMSVYRHPQFDSQQQPNISQEVSQNSQKPAEYNVMLSQSQSGVTQNMNHLLLEANQTENKRNPHITSPFFTMTDGRMVNETGNKLTTNQISTSNEINSQKALTDVQNIGNLFTSGDNVTSETFAFNNIFGDGFITNTQNSPAGSFVMSDYEYNVEEDDNPIGTTTFNLWQV